MFRFCHPALGIPASYPVRLDVSAVSTVPRNRTRVYGQCVICRSLPLLLLASRPGSNLTDLHTVARYLRSLSRSKSRGPASPPYHFTKDRAYLLHSQLLLCSFQILTSQKIILRSGVCLLARPMWSWHHYTRLHLWVYMRFVYQYRGSVCVLFCFWGFMLLASYPRL